MDTVKASFIYCGELGFYGLKSMNTDAKGNVTAVVSNGISLEKWKFREEKTATIGNTIYLSGMPRRIEWKGKRNER